MGGETSKKLQENVDRLAENDSRCVEVNCEGLKIGDRGMAALSDALRTNTRLKSLRLGGCDITHVGVQALADAICQSQDRSSVRRLDFTTGGMPRQGNPLGNVGAVSLAEILLDRYSQLQTLVVRKCNIGDEGAIVIADAVKTNRTLLTLELGDNLISDSGAERIGKALTENCTLKGLSLWHNRIFPDGAEGLAEGLRRNSRLEWLGLGCNHVGDIGLKAVCEALQANCDNSQLTWLALGGNNITDRGIKHLAFLLKGSVQETDNEVETRLDARTLSGTCCRLESIGLGGNDIANTGAGQLAEALQFNNVVKSLGLADNRIGDEGAIELANAVRGSETLETLVLSGNDIGDEGASLLAAALAQNRSLKSLFVAENELSDKSGRTFVEVLSKHNSTLKTLDLHNSAMSPIEMKQIVDALQDSSLTTVGGDLSHIKARSSAVRQSKSGNAIPLDMREKMPSRAPIFRSSAPGRDQTHRTIDSLPGDPLERSATVLAVEAFQEARTRSLESQGGADSSTVAARERAVKKAANKFLNLRLVSQQDELFDQQGRRNDPAQDETSFIVTNHHSMPSFPTNSSSQQYHSDRQNQEEMAMITENNVEDSDESEGEDPLPTVGFMDEQTGHDEDSDPGTVIGSTDQGNDVVGSSMRTNGMPAVGTTLEDSRDSTVERFEDITRSVSQSSGLSHLTKDRPRQSAKRRPSRSPSDSSMDKGSLEIPEEAMKKMVSNHMDDVQVAVQHEEEIDRDLHAVRVANIRQRTNIIQLGGSLQNLFDQIVMKDTSYNHDYTTARLSENLHKNFEDTHTPLPPEESRVELTLIQGMQGSDYINASFVGPLDEPKKFIVAQSPLEDTFQDFWRMIWEQSIRLIVMLGKAIEGGEVKCESYWPDWEGPGDDYGLAHATGPGKPGRWAPGALHVVSSKQRDDLISGVKVRDFTMEHTHTGEMRTVAMYQYVDWPDLGTPSSTETLVEFLQLLEKKREDLNPEWPLLVHGHVGAGRCGSFCAISIATEILSNSSKSTSGTISKTGYIVDDVISTIRSQRPGLVSNARQFEFIHQAVYQAINATVRTPVKGGISDDVKEDAVRGEKQRKSRSWFARGGKKEKSHTSIQSKDSSSSDGKGKFSLFRRKNRNASQPDTSALVSDTPVFDDALY